MGGMGGMGVMGSMGSMAGMGGPGPVDRGSSTTSREVLAISGAASAGKDNFTLGKELVTHVMDDMPSYVTQDPRGFVLRSAVPGRMASALQKKAVQVMGSSGTKIAFHGEASAAARMMSIEGPLFNVCAAYMLMMRRYLEVEREV